MRLTSPLNLPAPGRCQALYVGSRLGRALCFCKTVAWAVSLRPLPEGSRPPLSRSYRVNLPSSLAVIHSSTLESSSRPPVSVYGTGRPQLMLRRLFLEARSPPRFARRLRSDAPFRRYVATTALRQRLALRAGAGMLACCPSRIALRLTLRPRLTPR